MSRYINDKGQAAPAYLTDEQWRARINELEGEIL